MALISVILTVYNGEDYLRQCLDSVFSQTHTDLELIAVNDGSTDLTGKILEDYKKRGNVTLLTHDSKRGVFKSLNEALRQAKGEYITFIAHDDWWVQNKLWLELEQLTGSDAGVVYSDFIKVTGQKREEVRLPEHDKDLLKRRNYINISSCLVRKRDIDKLLASDGYCFNERLISAGDTEFWIRLTRFSRFKHLSQTLSFYRIHPKQVSKTLTHQRDRLRVYVKYNKALSLPLDLYILPLLRMLRKTLPKGR